MSIREIPTTPFPDQKPGTAGLRKKVATVAQPHYLENFVEAVFRNVPELRGGTLVVGGDGRHHNDVAVQTIIAMAIAHGVTRIIVGRNGWLSTPAASHLVRHLDADGGFVLTASHNPAGVEGDFGIKFNIRGGGQAPQSLTDAIHRTTLSLDRYRIADLAPLDIGTTGERDVEGCRVAVIDGVSDYADLMTTLFDFDAVRDWLRSGHRMVFDAMHAITGPYARRILIEQLGAPESAVRNATPLPDFNGGHPDPNLIHAGALVDEMMGNGAPDLAAASDGDGDRNMILGPGLFLSPGDSLAMLAAHLDRLPGYRDGLRGVARSMPTSRALDVVAAERGLPCHETPTGWKYFCNLLDAGRLTLCGEESFGTSSSHVREKDGLWAALAWMNVLAVTGRSLPELARAHWAHYGRHYYQRHDYEGLPEATADRITDALRDRVASLPGCEFAGLRVTAADDFAYTDPVDGSRAEHQGLRVVFGDAARIVLRKSGTGTGDATLRLYLERYRRDVIDDAACLDAVAEIAETITGLRAESGRAQPDVVT
ncbi:alpha-D-glucose phosphate-specific phosphoglucomutase [Algiphilus sp.]|uniref:alpha-D-glucose phosphate-specific phosphoglucomutase n=1 Tax=Algiphilus sp. TaxID=1872431 RepID=UPI0025C51DAF|nr:alpha-D-glucose phosphate-specific phosphoglucomutase [Algiphilus sp.]MCK5771882.1 alpha-D-glucose phosphate-specific phosphoglucomutase [Algiphilus sp.]